MFVIIEARLKITTDVHFYATEKINLSFVPPFLYFVIELKKSEVKKDNYTEYLSYVYT